jgi:hypothetical protein
MKGAIWHLFTMSFSLAHIASSKTGLTIMHMAIRRTGLSWAGILSVVLHLAAKLVQKEKDYSQ